MLYPVLYPVCILTCVYCDPRAGGGVHIEPQYRQYPLLTKKQVIMSEAYSGAMWFWILWHLWHDFDAVMVSQHALDEALNPKQHLLVLRVS